jgi:hypothetical protein
MPASLPGSSLASNLGNPGDGLFVMFDALSGPKGSPFDKDFDTGISGGPLPSGKCSTGAMQTGIGYNAQNVMLAGQIAPSFTDDYIPGKSNPASTDTMDSTYVYLGGGRCDANAGGSAAPNPYATGIAPLCGAGRGDGLAAGSSRDGGIGPAYTGFPVKTVTATGNVALGAAVEAGWLNRSYRAIVSGESVFGSSTTPNTAVS